VIQPVAPGEFDSSLEDLDLAVDGWRSMLLLLLMMMMMLLLLLMMMLLFR
jgi:hypothetical protein